jgi:mannose-6-phosphate isomerase-like protein (cupin superfamily)
MTGFATLSVPAEPTILAPDGSEVRVLLSRPGGSMAHFRLPPGGITMAVRHRTVEEIWFVLAGHGALWRSLDGRAETVALTPGVSATIPVGTAFQFRAFDEDLEILGVTMPPWPGAEEAVFVEGVWEATV